MVPEENSKHKLGEYREGLIKRLQRYEWDIRKLQGIVQCSQWGLSSLLSLKRSMEAVTEIRRARFLCKGLSEEKLRSLTGTANSK